MKEEMVRTIVGRLTDQRTELRERFLASAAEVGVRYCAVDDLLPEGVARRIYDAFPDSASMRLMDSFRERKYTSKALDRYDPILTDITFAMQDKAVVAAVSRITGVQDQIPDPSLYAGGLSAMERGHFLNPHLDNSHEATRTYYRTLNLLYYVTPDWKLEDGGNLELWDVDVRRNTTITSCFNRLVLMETTPTSWHSVTPVVAARRRCCVSNYYFSAQSPTGREYFNVTSFSARPEQRLRRAIAWMDNTARQALRLLVPSGLGKRDVYHGPRA